MAGMICRECGGLLHVGLRHECQPITTMEEGLRRVRRAQRARATFAAADLGDPIQSSGPIKVTPIRVAATVGTAIACRVAGCRLHNSDSLRASDEQVSA